MMERYAHGGAVMQAARELGLPPAGLLDLSASINPLGMPDGALAAARAALVEAVHYPEADAASLTAALAGHHRLPASCLLPGSGSTELLYLFPQVFRPRRALVVTPAFSEYERSLRLAGAAMDSFPLAPETGFQLDPERLLRQVGPETDLILLANPGNPTGAGVEPAAVEALARAVGSKVLVAVDEAFVDFCPQRSVLAGVPDHGNLFVFRSLTKYYAIPGLRVGFVAGPPAGIGRLAAARPPWPLSAPSLAAAVACLNDAPFRDRTRVELPAWREYLGRSLAALGLTVFPGEANFLLARREDGGTAAGLAAALRPAGILLRDCGNFPPLDSRFLRVAVRTPAETDRLRAALAGGAPAPGRTPRHQGVAG